MLTHVSAEHCFAMSDPRSQRKGTRSAVPWAAALRVRRAQLGKSQEAVALDSGILNQTTVSELEGGRYDIANLTAARLAGLARGLNWTLAEMETALGIDFGLSAYPSKADRAPTPPPALDLPPGLQDAIDRYGDDYEDLRTPKWQHFLARARFRGGKPQTAKDWLEVYRDFARTGYEPDELG